MINPSYIKYETGYSNCRDAATNTLVYKYIPLGKIVELETGLILRRGNVLQDSWNGKISLKDAMRIEWLNYINEEK